MSYRDWPVVLKRKWAATGTMGLLFLVVGGVAYLTLNDRTLLLISAALVLCTVIRCSALYRTIYTGNYEIVEGLCIEISKAGLHRQRKIRLLEKDGNEYSVLLDRRTPIRMGNYYRIYYEDCAGSRPESGMPLAFATHRFLAVEDFEMRDLSDSKEDSQ